MGWEDLIGPAITAAVISGLISLVLVQLNFRKERRIEKLQRGEKVRDFLIALRAEIRGELRNLSRYDVDTIFAEIAARYAREPGFSVSVPRMTRHVVFEEIAKELHILPEAVIEHVVHYTRQRFALESLVEDMREDRFRELSGDRQLAIYRDYLNMWNTLRDYAEEAEVAITNQTGGRPESVTRAGSGLPGHGLGGGEGA